VSVIEPILRRLPPKVVIPALLAALMLLGGHALANWRNGTAAVKASVSEVRADVKAVDERVQKAEVGIAAEVAARAQAQADVTRRLENIERKLDRALSRR
jgi:hypothetical protein